MITIQRYFIENDAMVNEANERTILSRVIRLAQNDSKRIIFVTSILEQNDILKRIFRGIDAEKFRRGILIKEYNGLYIRHVSYSQYLSTRLDSHVLISAYIDDEKIFDLENVEIAEANFVIPWGMTRVEKWARTTGAININTNLTLDPYPLPQRVIIDSLDKIISSVNILGFSTTDMQLVKNEFKQLRENGIALDRDEIEAYLMTHTNHYSWTFIKKFRKHSKI